MADDLEVHTCVTCGQPHRYHINDVALTRAAQERLDELYLRYLEQRDKEPADRTEGDTDG